MAQGEHLYLTYISKNNNKTVEWNCPKARPKPSRAYIKSCVCTSITQSKELWAPKGLGRHTHIHTCTRAHTHTMAFAHTWFSAHTCFPFCSAPLTAYSFPQQTFTFLPPPAFCGLHRTFNFTITTPHTSLSRFLAGNVVPSYIFCLDSRTPLKSQWKPLWSRNSSILRVHKTSTIWITLSSATNLGNSQIPLHQDCRTLRVSGWLKSGTHFYRQPWMSKCLKDSFLKWKTYFCMLEPEMWGSS